MNNDQEPTRPTQQKLEKAQVERNQINKCLPKRTSEYQAVWIASDEEDNNSNNEQNLYSSQSLPFNRFFFVV